MKKLFAILLLVSSLHTSAQNYSYGNNLGWYGTQYQDSDIAQLAYNSGARTIRPFLPFQFMSNPLQRLSTFQRYKAMGMNDITAFVGVQYSDTNIIKQMYVGLYLPTWNADGTINKNNVYAYYMYTMVNTYGPYVKFWEIINEPDFSYTADAWNPATVLTSWWNRNPKASELPNVRGTVYTYIRLLRVATEVIKKLQPTEYVCTGGIGYPSFLDALLRNTDNPVDGSVTAAYPSKAGAYFDVLSFHSYPFYTLNYWDNSCGCTKYRRYSDTLVDVLLSYKAQHQALLVKYGYPSKKFIITETDQPRQIVGNDWGSSDAASNFIVKYNVLGQVAGILEIYKFGLGEGADGANTFNKCGLYGDLTAPTTTVANAPKNPQFYVFKTMSDNLYGKRYDSVRTKALNLPANIRGAAFKDTAGLYTYCLWAKTSINESEVASASYTFPFTVSGTMVDNIGGGLVLAQNISLTGSPVYITEKYVDPNPIMKTYKLTIRKDYSIQIQ